MEGRFCATEIKEAKSKRSKQRRRIKIVLVKINK